jgi:5-methylcytosine-specific restriction enzyme subunit McrC
MSVPLRNIYYLLCYAWDHLETLNSIEVGAIPGNRVENLLGKVLQDGVAHLIRRGLDRGYVPFDEDGRRLRGKVLLSETVGRVLLPRGRVACQVDELSYDVPHNQVLKAAMQALIELPQLDPNIRKGLRAHCRRLHSVTDVDLEPAAFRRVQLHRNIARYGFLMNVAYLIGRSFLPDKNSGKRRFHPFTASDQEMGQLFEAFVRNFLRREQDRFHVSRPKVPWTVAEEMSSDVVWLPEMQTDVLLESLERRVVIETKYYATPYQSRHGGRKIISDHLYQLLTYLAHLRETDGPEPMGLLLYAEAGDRLNLRYRLGGHHFLIRTLDLNRDWEAIHRDLLELVGELADQSAVRVPA